MSDPGKPPSASSGADTPATGQQGGEIPPADSYQPSGGTETSPGQGDRPPGKGGRRSAGEGGRRPPGGGGRGRGDGPLPDDDDDRPRGPWTHRVLFSSRSDGAPFAYRPHELLTTGGAEAAEVVSRYSESARMDETIGPFTRFVDVTDPLRVVRELEMLGYKAQPNHVFFAHSLDASGWSPTGWSPTGWSPTGWSPTGWSPTGWSPTGWSPTPWSPTGWSPTGWSPTGWSPTGATPEYDKVVSSKTRVGPHMSSARPPFEDEPVADIVKELQHSPAANSPHVIVFDTGLAAARYLPDALKGTAIKAASAADHDHPDETGDGLLDPVAGHGTFIAGLIGQVASGCDVTVHRVLATYGDTSEWPLLKRLYSLSLPNPHRTVLSMSFGGYVLDEPFALAWIIRSLVAQGVTVVASAGNDASSRPTFPAALPGVISVGAVGPNGPAVFTNYGSWVSACAPGVDVLSTFFEHFDGLLELGPDGTDPDDFDGWAHWSGTSFSTPIVVGNLARMMMTGMSAREAIDRVIDGDYLMRIPHLGTVVNFM